ncbi:hypothetical protein BP6252_07829 [Coleophoma cylindrospora]|uniref:U3 small nucleolar RNA-associated protein 10 n=1 Tax=Coleophoma cylindrospora TaxID=1849047 RepID=A0A3D8RBB9_9HELO|nr:hypothetical protein BP6252_07829 [Coleophoma cylindrospora]
MASILGAQLAQIAANSTNSLNLKAQKAAHSKSLIFEPRVAASQSFDTIYTICHEGFQELCLLDDRFREFQRTIFSEQSQEEDRTQMTAAENAELDRRLEAFMGLVGARLRLNPGVKAVEWLVRRFRVHEYNTSFLLATFLPYHTLPIFTALLSILPANLAHEFRFLQPYIRSLSQPPRHAIVHATINNTSFALMLNSYVINVSKVRHHHQALLAFWAGIMTEATSGMLDKARSGRKGVQQQNEQDVIMGLLPTLNEALALKKVPDLRIGCYMLLSVLASKGGLQDKILTAMMEAVVLGWTTETTVPGLVCLSVLAQHRTARQLTKRLTKELLKVSDLANLLTEISQQQRVDKLAAQLCGGLMDRLVKSGDARGLSIIGEVIKYGLLVDEQIERTVKALLLAALRIRDDTSEQTRSDFAALLVSLTQMPGHSGAVALRAISGNTEIDMDNLEMNLRASIRPKALEAASEDTPMEDANDVVTGTTSSLSELVQKLPARVENEVSFLTHKVSHIYSDLCRAFLASIITEADKDQFDGLPILQREALLSNSLYLTLYMRIWCGPYPVMARTSAIQMATRCLSKSIASRVDFQAAIPYAIAALNDPATKVRRAAAELLIELQRLYPDHAEGKKATKDIVVWAFDDIYGTGEETAQTKWLPVDVVSRLLRDVILPSLEECVLDKNHIESVLEKALNGPRNSTDSPKKTDSGRLTQAARASIMSFLASHAVNTPIMVTKLRLLKSLNQVRGVASTTRTKVLLPLLQQWADTNLSDATARLEEEQLDLTVYNDQALLVITATDKEGLNFLAAILSGEVATTRPDLLSAAFRRLRSMWTSLKGELRLHMAQRLMDTSQHGADGSSHQTKASEEASQFLNSVSLSTDILLSFLSQLPTATKLSDSPPATKRRRTSHGEVAKTSLQDPAQLSAAIQKVTFVLQLVDGSNPAGHPELLGDLFNVLAELQHFKAQVSSELAYLQGLVLGSMVAIMQAHKSDPNMKLDRSTVRADLLVDCVQKTASPQVQNSALLLIASLAATAPELVLHSVMPIFTFMGSSVLRQNDEYSAHVINQTIQEVIPPLISSLRQEKGNPVTGAAELLLSFVAAYEHVPAHRRQGLFTSLVQTLGAEDFLFALETMLVDKYGATDDIKNFIVEVSGAFGVEIQLQTAVKFLELVADVLKPKPSFSSILLSTNDDGLLDPQRIALQELSVLPHLLSQRRLVRQTGKVLERDDMDAARVRDLYATLLEDLLAMAETLKGQKSLHNACGDVLESILGLLSTAEFVKSVESLLDRPDEALRRKILRSLEARIEKESPSDSSSRIAMLGFLPQLTAIIRESKDVFYKHTAVRCVDLISEKYGKKDLEAVAAAAETIAGDYCLGQSESRLRVMALLCLSSLVEILHEGIVPVLPVAIPKALDYISQNLRNDDDALKLHNAGYAFISSLVHHLPYMISGGFLDQLLTISNASAAAELDDEASECRLQCLRLAAKQIDAKAMFSALDQDWSQAATAGPLALHEYLLVLSIAIEKHPKMVVTKHASVLSKIFLNAFDLRRQWISQTEPLSEEDMSEIESEVNDVAIKMIYKFNDATFRPIFANLVEWAASSLPKKDTAGRILRLQSIYSFMAIFFDNLKSIVTSYATYLLENAVEVLSTVDPKDKHSQELWSRVLLTLVKCFQHDQDDFWQAPSHFGAIAPALCNQFLHASSLPLVQSLIPAIVELAAAADSQDHHKELNTSILKHMRSENASIRLAAVRCQQALTDRLGEEWLAMLPEMLPFISELQEDDDDVVEKETHRWIVKAEGVLGESLDSMLQ